MVLIKQCQRMSKKKTFEVIDIIERVKSARVLNLEELDDEMMQSKS
jgi:hypothetical protein